MTATIVLTGICTAGVVFMVMFLYALHRERPTNERCRVERILPHNVIEWDVDIESPLPGVKHAVPRRSDIGRVAMRDESFEENGQQRGLWYGTHLER